MKLIISDADNHELEAMKELLEKNGIPAFINGKNTSRIMPFIITKASLWIHLSEQENEALLLINDPDYEVKNKVNMDEYYKIKNEFKNNPENLSNALGEMLVFIGAIMVSMFVLAKVMEWLNT